MFVHDYHLACEISMVRTLSLKLIMILSLSVDNMQAVSVIVTPSHLFLLDENHLVPLSKTAAATASNRNEHFMLRDQQKLNNIAYVVSISVFSTRPCQDDLVVSVSTSHVVGSCHGWVIPKS